MTRRQSPPAHALEPTAIAAMFAGEQLAISPEWEERFATGALPTLLDMRAARRGGRRADMFDSTSSGQSDLYERVGDVGIVTISGPLMQTGGGWWFDGHAAIRARIEAAVAGGVKRLALRIDSPGGVVAGNFDAVRASIACLAAAGIKCDAWCGGGGAFSAAFAWACVASSISLPDTGGVASVGVLNVLTDRTKQNDIEGVKRTVVRSGTRKAEGHPDVPTTDAAIQRDQVIVDAFADIFASIVSTSRMAARGTSGAAMTPEAVLAPQGQCFYGVEAVKSGFADRVESWDSFLARVQAMAEEESMKGLKGYLGLAEDASDERVMQVMRERDMAAETKARAAVDEVTAAKALVIKAETELQTLASEMAELVCAEALVAGKATAAEIEADKQLVAHASKPLAARQLRDRYAARQRGAALPKETKAPVDAPQTMGPEKTAALAATKALNGAGMTFTEIASHYGSADYARLLSEHQVATAPRDRAMFAQVNIGAGAPPVPTPGVPTAPIIRGS